jgi:acyl-CoA synthetase (AMP-forming)/AMP-acid ligase II
MYTSGTTGKPKGAIRSHHSFAAFYLINDVELGYGRDDCGLLVMPMAHINSIFYSFVFTVVAAPAIVYNMVKFEPEHLLATLAKERITFTSLVPTHYIMMLALPDAVKAKYDVSCVKKLMISSAPARKETKLGIMGYFKNSQLFEAYGSTEAGCVTLLRPDQQFAKLGSIGREVIGTDRLLLLDENRKEVPDGEVGELFSRGPMMFDGYYRDEERTRAAFFGEYFSAGDMARRDADGFYTLVDRKNNMIITGGEKVFPSEVEALIGSHPSRRKVGRVRHHLRHPPRRQDPDRRGRPGPLPREDLGLQGPQGRALHQGRGDAPHRHGQDPPPDPAREVRALGAEMTCGRADVGRTHVRTYHVRTRTAGP